MKILGIQHNDYVNYKKPSFIILFPYCTFKCGPFCQNKSLINCTALEVSFKRLYETYQQNSLNQALVLSGLEPFDSFQDLCELIEYFRNIKKIKDDIVIYTGYTEEELYEKLKILKHYIGEEACGGIIIKYGRYQEGKDKVLDSLLGVTLASDNQYAKELKNANS